MRFVVVAGITPILAALARAQFPIERYFNLHYSDLHARYTRSTVAFPARAVSPPLRVPHSATLRVPLSAPALRLPLSSPLRLPLSPPPSAFHFPCFPRPAHPALLPVSPLAYPPSTPLGAPSLSSLYVPHRAQLPVPNATSTGGCLRPALRQPAAASSTSGLLSDLVGCTSEANYTSIRGLAN
ncbi:hypothetical protein K525DRAFT_265640 [Schizophyllum commune Loenen D]|nr:hypothetical protein K525DRAFT_265640 [Schizophyllum commune Loenen D]